MYSKPVICKPQFLPSSKKKKTCKKTNALGLGIPHTHSFWTESQWKYIPSYDFLGQYKCAYSKEQLKIQWSLIKLGILYKSDCFIMPYFLFCKIIRLKTQSRNQVLNILQIPDAEIKRFAVIWPWRTEVTKLHQVID